MFRIVDIIGAGTYTKAVNMPHAWVRYRIESVIEAIQLAGFKVGPNYLRGEKTPIGIPMCYSGKSAKVKFNPISAHGAYHDFYSCLASGARGILVFSYFHRKDSPETQKAYIAYAKAASELGNKNVGLGQALLFGMNVPCTVQITKGPARTKTFRPKGMNKDISYPSINVRAMKWRNNLYIIAVNSSEQETEIEATLTILPPRVNEAKVLFENRTVPILNEKIQDTFKPLGVHVYKAPL